MSDLTEMRDPVRCTHCGKVYDLSTVTVVARYLDCSVWLCPGHGGQVDDRGETGWTTRRDYVRVEKVPHQDIFGHWQMWRERERRRNGVA